MTGTYDSGKNGTLKGRKPHMWSWHSGALATEVFWPPLSSPAKFPSCPDGPFHPVGASWINFEWMFNFSAASMTIRPRGRGGLDALLQAPCPHPAWRPLPGHSPGGGVPLRLTLNQDVIPGIHDVVLHRLLGDGRRLGHCNRVHSGRSGLQGTLRPWLGEGLK